MRWSFPALPDRFFVVQVGVLHALTMVFYLTSFVGSAGQVAEWLKAPVSKTGIPFTRYREFESLPVRSPVSTERRGCAGPFGSRCFGVALHPGWVAEWFKAHAWKACLRQKRNVGSNPTPSVAPA
jgi:hypothetical protein